MSEFQFENVFTDPPEYLLRKRFDVDRLVYRVKTFQYIIPAAGLGVGGIGQAMDFDSPFKKFLIGMRVVTTTTLAPALPVAGSPIRIAITRNMPFDFPNNRGNMVFPDGLIAPATGVVNANTLIFNSPILIAQPPPSTDFALLLGCAIKIQINKFVESGQLFFNFIRGVSNDDLALFVIFNYLIEN